MTRRGSRKPSSVLDDWLDSSEQELWQPFLYGVRALEESLDRELLTEHDISHAYFEILVPLSAAPNRSLRMSELANQTGSSRSRLSHAVGRLEQRGLVSRTVHEVDGRGQVARLTTTGLRLVRKAAPRHARAVRARLLDRLNSEQRAQLRQLGRILLESSDADGSTGTATGSPASRHKPGAKTSTS